MKNFYIKYIKIPLRIFMYVKLLLFSTVYFTEDDSKYFGKRIYELRQARKFYD